jgi:hypothetical protein
VVSIGDKLVTAIEFAASGISWLLWQLCPVLSNEMICLALRGDQLGARPQVKGEAEASVSRRRTSARALEKIHAVGVCGAEQVPGQWRKPKRHAAAQRPDPAASPLGSRITPILSVELEEYFGRPRDTCAGSDQRQPLRRQTSPFPAGEVRSSV